MNVVALFTLLRRLYFSSTIKTTFPYCSVLLRTFLMFVLCSSFDGWHYPELVMSLNRKIKKKNDWLIKQWITMINRKMSWCHDCWRKMLTNNYFKTRLLESTLISHTLCMCRCKSFHFPDRVVRDNSKSEDFELIMISL
jgi:hypothetical protein